MRHSLLFVVILFCSISISAQDKICLFEGTRISVVTTNEISSQRYKNPNTVIAADVYDQDGEYILIKKGTRVEVQTRIHRASAYDQGLIELLPISTTAIDGRQIVFQDQPVSFNGQDGILISRKKVKIAAGTAFAGYTANTYCFKIEKLNNIK